MQTLYYICNYIIKANNSYMFGTLLGHHQGVQYSPKHVGVSDL
jgi:hypothetical protein